MEQPTSDHEPEQPKVPANKQATTATHPLQEVALNDATENPEDIQQQAKATSKANWVRFDDDALEISETNTNDMNNASGAAAAANIAGDAVDASSTAAKLSPLSAAAATTIAATTTKSQTTTTPLSATRQASAATKTAAGEQQPALKPTSGRPTQQQSKGNAPDVAPAVLTTESTHVNLNASGKALQQKATHVPTSQQLQLQQHQHHNNNGHKQPASATINSVIPTTTAIAVPNTAESAGGMRTIELSTGRIREGFANGDVIVTLLPTNTKCPWITPAIFRPELVPEELMAQGLTLTVEDYVNAMETLVNDYRFTVYNICYKRILIVWIFFAFAVLLTLLFSGLQGVALFSLGVAWLFLNAAAIFLCMWVKLRLSRGLEKCLARVNRQLMKHKILLVLDDRGRISCHKVNLCFLYFDATQCVKFLDEFLEQTEQNGGEAIKAGWEAKLDIDLNDIVIQGNNPVRLSRKQERGGQLFLRYGARWGMEALRGLIDITPLEPGRHCGQFQCPCQYIKAHLKCKPRGYPCSCIAYYSDPYFQNRYY